MLLTASLPVAISPNGSDVPAVDEDQRDATAACEPKLEPVVSWFATLFSQSKCKRLAQFLADFSLIFSGSSALTIVS